MGSLSGKTAPDSSLGVTVAFERVPFGLRMLGIGMMTYAVLPHLLNRQEEQRQYGSCSLSKDLNVGM